MSKQVLVPPLGQTTAEVNLVHWYKREGDAVQAGEPLYAIETDKAVLDIEAPASGVLRQVMARDGDTVPVLQPIAVIVAPGESGAEAAASTASLAVAPEAVAARVENDHARTVREPTIATARPAERERRFISPRARRLAEAEGLDWSNVVASGPEGAVVERDVRTALAARAETKVRARAQVDRSTTAVLFAEVDMSEAWRMRAQLESNKRAEDLSGLLERIVRRASAAWPAVQAAASYRDELEASGRAGSIPVGHNAIVCLGRTVERAWVVAGQVSVRPIGWLGLAYDAVALDEAMADAFLGDVRRLLEQPALLLT
jgi:pyruvate/2-oxoglutarate dehydrogenase complex dihydrolipoamide acyltransferase (E2) component